MLSSRTVELRDNTSCGHESIRSGNRYMDLSEIIPRRIAVKCITWMMAIQPVFESIVIYLNKAISKQGYFHHKPMLLYIIPKYRRLTWEDGKHRNENF